MYQIGEFSHLCETTIKTLRYYDKINLLKPSVVDKFSGYRYYDDVQMKQLFEIKKLQKVGFSLSEIKTIMKEKDVSMIEKKIIELEKEYKEKFDILEEKKVNMKGNSVGYGKFKNIYFCGYFRKIKNRSEIAKIRNKYFNNVHMKDLDDVFISYEKGYKETNIKCFIGKCIDLKNEDLVNYCKMKKMSIIDLTNNNRVKTFCYVKVRDINAGYKDIIRYANEHNIQLRGEFQELKNGDETDIYIEAYDLSTQNKNTIEYNEHVLSNLKNKHSKKYVGKWIMQGEIIELPKQFKYKDEHYIPDTMYNTLELYEDGSTNLENVTWADDYLIVNEDDVKYVHNLYPPKKRFFTTYMEILLNGKNNNKCGNLYYYKKVQ